MSRRVSPALVCVCAALAGCGGGSDSASSGSASPTPTATATATPGVDVASVNDARDAFVTACAARDDGKDVPSIADLEQAAAPLLAELRRNPDLRFRRSPGVEPTTMREQVRALALIAKTECGDSKARRLGDRLRTDARENER